jgi:O-antigen ligase
VAGIAGYFDIFPGAHELFTTYDRARGTFKDPNVFGPFLVPPLVWAVHMGLNARPLRAALPLIAFAFLSFAVLLSFSRGAWANLAVALLVYGILAFLLADGDRTRAKIVGLLGAALAAAALAFAFAMQFDAVSDLISERASLNQSYDVNPGGRFDGQLKARDIAAAHPLGIGAGEFNTHHHGEDVHNVYLSMLLNAGWLGGFGYLCVVLVTLFVGLRQLLKRSPVQDLLIIAWACFLAVALEGLIVDTDHWRHFFVLMALVWGLSEAVRSTESYRAPTRTTEFAETRLRIPPLPAKSAFVSSANLLHERPAALPPRLPPAPGGFGRRR